MKHKSLFTLGISLFFLVVISGIGNAVECNEDLTQGGEICTVSDSFILNGTYNINMNGSSSSAGILDIGANDILLDCNGTTLYGNSTSNGRAVNINNHDNITINNCNFYNYTRGVQIYGGSYNIIVQNSTFTSMQQGVYSDSQSYNISVYNSTFFSFPSPRTGIFLQQNPYNVIIQENIFKNNYKSIEVYDLYGTNKLANNEFINGTQIDGSPFLSDVLFSNSTGVNVTENTFNNGSYWQLRFTFNSSDSKIFNNNFTKALKYSIFLDNLTNNMDIFDNKISLSGRNGIVLSSENNKVYNNTISYSNHHGIDIHCGVSTAVLGTCINNLIENNTILNNLGNAEIYLENSSYNTLRGNNLINTTSTKISLTEGSSHNNITENILNDTLTDAFNIWVDTESNIIEGNTLNGIQRYSYQFFMTTNNIIKDNYINFNNTGVYSGAVNYTLTNTHITNSNESVIATLNLFNLTSPTFFNGTLTSGTTLTNTESTIVIPAGGEIYVS